MLIYPGHGEEIVLEQEKTIQSLFQLIFKRKVGTGNKEPFLFFYTRRKNLFEKLF